MKFNKNKQTERAKVSEKCGIISHNGKLFPVLSSIKAFGQEGEGVEKHKEQFEERYQQPKIGFIESHHRAFIDKCT